MSMRLDDRATRRLHALHRYVLAVDAGHLDEVAGVLAQAETDPALARLLDELHAALAESDGDEIALAPVASQDAESPAAITTAPRIAREEKASRELIFESEAAPVPVSPPARQPRRVGRVANALQAVAAVLVLGALLAGFFALNQSRFGRPGGTPVGHTTVIRSGLVPNPAQGVVAAGTWDGAVVALRPGDGKLYWRFSSGTGHPVTNVIVAGGVVYANTEYGDIFALRMSDGALLWQRALGQFEGYPDQFALTAGVVLVTAADGLHALRAIDGKPLWTSLRVPLLSVADGLIFVGTTRLGPAFPGSSVSNISVGTIEALRASDGSVAWTAPITANDDATGGALEGDTLVVNLTGPYVGIAAFRASDGHALWTRQEGDLIFTADQAQVYVNSNFGTGTPICASALADGATRWCKAFATVLGVALPAAGIVCILTVSDQVVPNPLSIVGLRTANGSTAWTTNLGRQASLPVGPLGANPSGISVGSYNPSLIAGSSAVYFAQYGGLYALRASDGRLLWHAQPQDDYMSLAFGA